MIHKENCTIYTPVEYANTLLDSIGYESKNSIYDKKILEFSCGEGSIIIEILKRYVSSCKLEGFTDEMIVNGILKNIVAYEIDELIALKCENNINEFLSKEFQIFNVNYKVYVCDFLLTSIQDKFDYVVGNPPYISYHALMSNPEKYSLDNLRETFECCANGSFDYAYPFIEKTLSVLSKQGKISLLIPNSIFKNKSAKKLRSIIQYHTVEIYDYAKVRVFSDALISTAIIVLHDVIDKTDYIVYHHNNKKTKLKKNKVFQDKWVFIDENFKGKDRFGDLFRATFSCATLCNEAFVINDPELYERDLLKITGSPKSLKRGLKEFIIYPYKVVDNELTRISEITLSSDYPNIYNHLLQYKDKLLKTDKDKTINWFEYGRTQGLRLFNVKKVLMSPIVTNVIHLYEMEEDSIPYSGIVISPIKGNDLNIAIKILESERFMRYVEKYGTSRSGTSIQVGTSMIEDYLFDLEDII